MDFLKVVKSLMVCAEKNSKKSPAARKSLTGVFLDIERRALVATNGKIMAGTNWNGPEGEGIYFACGGTIDAHYPAWHQCLPNGGEFLGELDMKSAAGICRGIIAEYRKLEKAGKMFLIPPIELGGRVYDAKELLALVRGLSGLGVKRVKVFRGDGNVPARFDAGESWGVIMNLSPKFTEKLTMEAAKINFA
jgi:hypothetical protein